MLWMIGGGIVYLYLVYKGFQMWWNDFKDDWGWGVLIGGLLLSISCAIIIGPVSIAEQMKKRFSGRGVRSAKKIGAFLAGEGIQRKSPEERIKELEARNAELERELEFR